VGAGAGPLLPDVQKMFLSWLSVAKKFLGFPPNPPFSDSISRTKRKSTTLCHIYFLFWNIWLL
jgi:hypothetical protein